MWSLEPSLQREATNGKPAMAMTDTEAINNNEARRIWLSYVLLF